MSTEHQWQVWSPKFDTSSTSADVVLASTPMEAAESWATRRSAAWSTVGRDLAVVYVRGPGHTQKTTRWEVRVVPIQYKAKNITDLADYDRLHHAVYGRTWTERNSKADKATFEDAAVIIELANEWADRLMQQEDRDLHPTEDALLDNIMARRV